jgi:hypothetical protein
MLLLFGVEGVDVVMVFHALCQVMVVILVQLLVFIVHLRPSTHHCTKHHCYQLQAFRESPSPSPSIASSIKRTKIYINKTHMFST